MAYIELLAQFASLIHQAWVEQRYFILREPELDLQNKHSVLSWLRQLVNYLSAYPELDR